MISVILGLILVAVIGGGITGYVRANPTSATRLRAKRTNSKRTKRAFDRDRGGTLGGAIGAKIARGGRWAWRRVRTRTERAEAKTKQFHAAAKKRGKTAATRAMTLIKDRRGWRAAWGDLLESVTGRTATPGWQPRERHPPKDRQQPKDRKPAPHPEPDTDTDTEGGKPMPEPDSEPDTTSKGGPTLVTLFEITDQMNALPFESLMQIKQFIAFLGMGCESIARMYIDLGQRMGGPMSIDRIVTEPVERCGAHQRAIHGSVSEAERFMIMVLNSTPRELTERGINLPRAHLINGQATVLGRALVPAFYETASTLATRPVSDLRDIHALLKGLCEASAGQFRLYRRIAARLGELHLPGVAGHFWTASRQQGFITAAMADADTAMGRLLNMTLRELATSNVRAPEMQLNGL